MLRRQYDTRHFFIQLWALVDRLDSEDGPLLRTLYHYDIGQLKTHIREVDPEAPEQELETRANLLASLIEGSMVVWGNQPAASRRRQLVASAVATAWSIVRPG